MGVVRAPVVVAKWLIVGVAVLAWLVLVPVVELVRGVFEAVYRRIPH